MPTGGSVSAGSASISQPTASSLVIDQSSAKAILNWDSFSIGSGYSVVFNNGTGATLNRVTGNVPSRIDGLLSASGSVYLINPAGVAVGSGGQVATGGSFVASTLDVGDAAFLAGGALMFSGISQAAVVNAGRIGASNGDVLLLARSVDNSGAIEAAEGTVGLAAGYEVLVSDGGVGGGRLSVKVGGTGTSAGTSGTIRAAVAELRANGGNVYALAGNTDGVIAATGVANQGGRIVLTAGEGGTATVSGQLSARNADGSGGQVVVSGETVAVKAGAAISADGTSGGVVLVGGDYQGGSDPATKRVSEAVATAKTTSVAAGAMLSANGGAGQGGSVVVWADDTTHFAGAVSATGTGGNGGSAEVSGKRVLDFTGTVDLRSQGGKTGGLLLDPYNLTISNGAGSNVTAGADDSVLNAAILAGLLSSANVTVSTGSGGNQDGDITVNAPVAWSTDTVLTLSAAGNIIFNAGLTATGTNAGLELEYGVGKDYSLNNAAITLSGGNASLSINGTDYRLIHSMAELDGIDDTGLGGNYALAQDLTSTGTYFDGLVGTQITPFSGTFAGLGHSISNLSITGTSSQSGYIGLFRSTDSASLIRDFGLVDVNVVSNASVVGSFAGGGKGQFLNVYATGSVQGFFNTGGLIGYLDGVSALVSGSSFSGTVASTNNLAGGLIGSTNRGTVSNSYASATVSGALGVGGLIGTSDYGQITDSYALGAVSGSDNVGGLVGRARYATVNRSYAANTVSGSHSGGIAGYMIGATFNSVFWDKTVSGLSNAVGDYSSGTLTAVSGLTTAELQDTAGFMATATGWDFQGLWMPSSSGYYPELYALSNVVWVSGTATSSTYGDSSATRTVTAHSGGAMEFATSTVAADPTAGGGSASSALSSSGSLSNAAGTSYRVLYYGTDTVTVTPAALVITATNAQKTYGSTNSTMGQSISGLRNNDTVSGVTLASDGLAASAGVGNYGITASGASGSGLSNYVITYVDGTLTVAPAALTVTAANATKTYGDAATLTYTTTGLLNGDTVTGMSLSSDGAGTGAGVGDYGIIASNATGNGLSNYVITYADGTLTVNPAALVITATNAQKIYGRTDSTAGYSISGLRNSDAVSGVTLASDGFAAGAGVGGYGITASDATGSGLSNYAVTYVNGALTVSPAALTITAADATKNQGGTATLSDYAVNGLVNGDSVSAVMLSSAGSAPEAGLGTYAITAANASGSGLSNYTITYVDGTLTIVPAVRPTGSALLAGRTLPRLYGATETGGMAGIEAMNTAFSDAGNGACTAGASCATQSHPDNTRFGRYLSFAGGNGP